MILYYAVGGGLGHLTRGRRLLEALGLADRVAFVTASPYAQDPRVTGGIPVLEVPVALERDPAAHREWLQALLREHQPERLIADAFPAGIQGELVDLPVPMDYVARILRLDEYGRAAGEAWPRFGTTWLMEELTPEHEVLVRARSERVLLSPLPSGERAGPSDSEGRVRGGSRGDTWLIVHSGPEDEVTELIEYALTLRDLAEERPERILVATRCDVLLPDGFAFTRDEPATLYPGAARIISAAGFNVMHETAPFAGKHHPVPFPRRFDDQFLRASRRHS